MPKFSPPKRGKTGKAPRGRPSKHIKIPDSLLPIVSDMFFELKADTETIRTYLLECGVNMDRGALALLLAALPEPEKGEIGPIYLQELRKIARDVAHFRAEAAKIWHLMPDYEKHSRITYFRLLQAQLEGQKIIVKATALMASDEGKKVEQALKDLEVKLGLDMPDDVQSEDGS